MSLPQSPFKNRSREYTSVSSPVTFDPPIAWLQCIGAGNVVLKDEAGTAVTYANMAAYEVLCGPFSELTSMTSSKVRMGDGQPPETELIGLEASAATSMDTRTSSAESATTSTTSRFSTADSSLSSADTSTVSRFSAADSALTSTDTSTATRFSTSVSTLTSQATSLTSRISVAESVEASKG